MTPNFPGMNPYLENPALWPEVHSWLIVELARSLNPRLVPKYRAAVEKRVYSDAILVGIPDASVFEVRPDVESSVRATQVIPKPVRVTVPQIEERTERYLEIREVKTGRVITAIELLSPTNKRGGEGRQKYLTKRQKVLNSTTHLVEIDLLRSGDLMPMTATISSDYRILVSRANLRPEAELYPFNLREPIPAFSLPLLPQEREPIVNLAEILDRAYSEAALDLTIDYSQLPIPPLKDSDREWMRSLM